MENVVGGEVREERARETDRVVLVGPCKDLDSGKWGAIAAFD